MIFKIIIIKKIGLVEKKKKIKEKSLVQYLVNKN